MNRRGLFSFFAAAPVGAVAALSLKEPTPKDLVYSGGSHRCYDCGSPTFHYVPDGRRALAECTWCRAPWDFSEETA
jgi:hypothetical protein